MPGLPNESISSSSKAFDESADYSAQPVTMAVCLKWYNSPEHTKWLLDNGFALEYAPDLKHFYELSSIIGGFLKAGVNIRHHGLFPGHDIGNKDPEKAEKAMQVHLAALDSICGLGEPFITIHIGLLEKIEIDPGRAVENLTRLVEYGKNLDITVCLENIRQGPASVPETVLEWAEKSDSAITLDIGHALSSETVQSGRLSVHDIIDMFEDRLMEIHMYEKEIGHHHYPPEDMSVLGPIVDRLMQTDCRWWTIELEKTAEILRTISLLKE